MDKTGQWHSSVVAQEAGTPENPITMTDAIIQPQPIWVSLQSCARKVGEMERSAKRNNEYESNKIISKPDTLLKKPVFLPAGETDTNGRRL